MSDDRLIHQLGGAEVLASIRDHLNRDSLASIRRVTNTRVAYRDAAMLAAKSGSVAALGEHIADDAVYISSEGVVRGKEAILKQYAERLKGMKLEELVMQPHDVEHHGDVILDEGMATQVLVGADGKHVTQRLQYHAVWKKAGANWQLYRVTWSC